MTKILFLISFLFLLNQSVSSQTRINSLDVSGNSYFTNSDILNMMVTKKDGVYKEEQFKTDLRAIRDRYKTSGYLYAKFSKEETEFDEDSANVDITLIIDEGNKVIVGDIEIHGNNVISKEKALKQFETKVGDNLDDVTLNNDIKELLASYEKLGLPFAKVNINDISVYKENGREKLKIDLTVTENSKVKIEQVKIKGNETTDDKVIIRELNLDKNKTVNSESLKLMKERLDKLAIFESVSDPKIYSLKNKNESGLLIEVTEGNTNTFDGVLGYVPPVNENESGYLTGYVYVSFKNLFGTGRKLEANYQQEVQETQELGFKYFEPYFFNLPMNFSLGFLQRLQDTTYTRRALDLKAEFPFSDRLTISGIAGYERIIPSAILNSAFVIADSRTLGVGTEIKYDNRDNIYVPTKGSVYKTYYLYGSKKIFNIAQLQNLGYQEYYSVQKYWIDIETYLSFFKRQTNLIRLFGGEIKSGQIEDADFFRIGGNKFIRGYRTDQFLASRLALGSLEMRYSISRKGFLFGFYDGGYYLRPADELNNIVEQSGYLYGFGIGIRLETGLGLIGVSYALGKDNGLTDGIINFGLINDF